VLRITDLTAPVVALVALPVLARRLAPVVAEAPIVFRIGNSAPAIVAAMARFI
jgi:hypothetical protein